MRKTYNDDGSISVVAENELDTLLVGFEMALRDLVRSGWLPPQEAADTYKASLTYAVDFAEQGEARSEPADTPEERAAQPDPTTNG